MANIIQSDSWATDVCDDKELRIAGLYIGLYTAPAGALTPAILNAGLVPAGGATLTEVTAAQLNGYARIPMGAGVVSNPVAGQGQIAFSAPVFNFTGGGTGTTILGWFIATGAVLNAGTVKFAEQEANVTPPLGVASTYTVGLSGSFAYNDQAQ